MECSLDALVVGGGFGGLNLLHSLRSQGFRVKGVEAGADIGGVWYWNNYPGARVDVDFLMYQFTNPELFQDFEYSHRFPGRDEVLRYFQHVESKLDLKRDFQFNTRVSEAEFNELRKLWEVRSSTGDVWKCRFLFLCTGATSKAYIPKIEGLEYFKGEVHHTSQWPKDREVEVLGKRVGVIGTGASGVQVIQELGPLASHITVFQRTPITAIPMRQSKIPNPKYPGKEDLPALFALSRTTFTGIAMDFIKQMGTETSAAERQATYGKLWNEGDFSFWLANYQDLLLSKEISDEAYEFWAHKTRTRINNSTKRELLVPLIPPYPFGAKQPSLEQTFYEVCDQDNVDIVDVNLTPIEGITESGLLKTSDGVGREFDLLVLATGFECLTGSVSNIRLKNGSGRLLDDKWVEEGTSTLFGLAVSGFPNLFFIYGPQAPTGLANGPRCAEIQGEWLTRLMLKMRREGLRRVEATKEAAEAWLEVVNKTWNATLLPQANSWYTGANIPGKRREVLTYVGGLAQYSSIIQECEEKSFEGFQME